MEPGFPNGTVENLAIAQTSSRNVTLNWTAVACMSTNGNITNYIVRYGATICNKVFEFNMTVAGSATEVTIDNLVPGQEYSFSVAAATAAGTGPKKDALRVHTKEEVPSGKPGNLSCNLEDFNSVLLSWEPVSCGESNGVVSKYRIHWTKQGDPIVHDEKNVSAINEGKASIEDLSASSDYVISVSGITSAGPSDSVSRCSISTTAGPAVVAASTAASVTLTCGGIVAVFIFYRRRRSRLTKSQTTTAIPIPVSIPEPAVTRKRPMKLSDLEDRVRSMHQNSNFLFDNEYRDLHDLSPQYPAEAAKLRVNLPKNRIMNIVPFDHSRVKLLPTEDKGSSDFINASFIPGNHTRRDYIAAQGPLRATINSFWQMIWEQNIPVIVMLSKTTGKGKLKREQYWPDAVKEPQIYGEITVIKIWELLMQNYTVRFLEIHLGDQARTVTQCHYTTWPSNGCPQRTDDMLNFVKAVQQRKTKVFGPILVHCSTGVGPTGTYICLERLLEQIQDQDDEQEVDIFASILEMRDCRPQMVQSVVQYAFIHDCIKDAIIRKRAPPSDITVYINIGGPSAARPEEWASYTV